ncbi:MAG TPA: aromatic hydrocarbon degradation protein [Desulfobacterales bacterium]|nr:aromatic hydrocarbon degradation protein [Desulfobacterales bacterium]
MTILSKERKKTMKKKISVLALSSILIAGSALASGYRIPEQSVDSVAKAGANIASASHADTSYYNPANMSWTKDAWQFEGALAYINLSSTSYEDNRSPLMNGNSESEGFIIPTFFLVSPEMNNFRFGISATAPFGLAKRWKQPFPRSTAEEYSLSVLELNPTVSYQTCSMFSIAAGVRMIYSTAKVTNFAQTSDGMLLTRSMDGDTTEWGYNLAASLRPMDELNISVVYRSNVDLGFEGDVVLGTNYPSTFVMASEGSVEIPAPAVLGISVAYTFGPATIDLTWERNFWSEYEDIAFKYDTPVRHPVLNAVFVPSVPKNWEDSDSYRIGLDYELNSDITLMAGFAYDENPVPEDTLNFELPDSDAWLYSLGVRYRVNAAMEIGMAYLYDYKEDRTVVNGSPRTGINGEFTDAAAHLFSFGVRYDF